jgi:NDP-sugar pyrophosphorylase family protein
MAILAGGLGTRLGELCKDTPKALLEVAGAPFIHHQLRLLKNNGFERVVVLAGYLGEMISQSVGDGSAFGLSVSYSFDWPELLGTGGALKKALPFLGERFMVIYGDSYLTLDYQAAAEAFERSGAPALMTVYHNEDNYDKSNVLFEGETIKIYDKNNRSPLMRHIDYGLGCLKAEALETDKRKFDLAEIYRSLSLAGKLAGYLVEERFYEIGSKSGLSELDAALRLKGESKSE